MELKKAELYWLACNQGQHFQKEVKKKCHLHQSSPLIPLHPFLDADKLIRVGGREQNSNRAYSNILSYSMELTSSPDSSSAPNTRDCYMLVLPSSPVL
jgi:hypothetical protein